MFPVDVADLLLDVNAVLVILSCLVLVTYMWLKRTARLPPGPTGIPFVGYVPFIDKSVPLWRFSQDLAERYNSDITSLNLSGTTAVFLTSRVAVKEAFQKRQDMTGRPGRNLIKVLNPAHEGLIASSGELWKEQRRFTHHMLRDFGMGKNAAEQNIQDESLNLCKHFEELVDTCDPIKLLEPAVANAISAIAFGKRFPYDDPNFSATLQAMNDLVNVFTSTYASILVSKNLNRLAPILYPNIKRESQINYDLICDFILGIIAERKESFDRNVINDLIDGFLLEQSKRTDTNHSFTDQQLRHLIFDLFIAGSETTTTVLRWTLLYLIKYPDIQERIYNEISSVIGCERVPNMSDRESTPFTEAFLLEIHRFVTVVPLSIVHQCNDELQFMGYTIPADSIIFSNLAAIHRDPKEFEDPDTFRPERFLDGDKVINADKVDQFGIGRRMCVGEALARMEIYIFFTTMVQRLQFMSADQEIDLNSGVDATISSPKPFMLHAIPRQ